MDRIFCKVKVTSAANRFHLHVFISQLDFISIFCNIYSRYSPNALIISGSQSVDSIKILLEKHRIGQQVHQLTTPRSNFSKIIKPGTFNCKLTVTSKMEPLNEHFLKVHKIFSKFQTEIEWNGKKQIRGCFSIEVVSKYTHTSRSLFFLQGDIISGQVYTF